MTEFSYTCDHLDTATDLSDFVETITLTDIGTGEVTSAVLRLYSFEGQFIRTAPLFDEYQKIQITITDDASNTYDRIYEIHKIIPIESTEEGNVVELEMMGQEWHLSRSYFAKQFYFETGFKTVEDIIQQYNDNNGTLQPEVVDFDNNTGNKLPKWTANFYDFNVAEKKVYDGCMEVVDRLGTTVAAGGGGDFWELYFQNGATSATIEMRAFVSGSLPAPGSEVTITDADEVNADPSEGGIDATQATVIAAWGDPQSGSNPPDVSKFHGEMEAFITTTKWVNPATSGQDYPQDALVSFLGNVYQSNIDDNSSTPPTNWTIKFVRDFLGASEYSPWTNNKAGHWKNSGSNPSGANFGFGTANGFWDGNLVVWDLNHYRTQVVERSADPDDISTPYLYGGVIGGEYRGFRVLVDPEIGPLGGVFAGNDSNNVAFSGNTAQFDGIEWLVKRITSDGEEIAVTHEGIVYEKQTGTWVDIHATARANDCFHNYSSLSTDAGVNNTIKSLGPTTTYGDTSAIRVTYKYTPLLTGLLQDANENFYQVGAWLNLRFPFPFNTYNSVPTLGVLWGNNATKKEPVTFDTNNMHFTHSGLNGFNNVEAIDLGPTNAVNFAMRLLWLDTFGARMLKGDFKIRCIMYDTSDNVVFQDFTIPFNNQFWDISLPHTKFQIYRARIPYRYELDNILAAFVLDNLDIINVFEFKNVKSICFQTQESYDNQGRYLPEFSRYSTDLALETPLAIIQGRQATIELTIDRYSFRKPLLAITAPVTDRPLITSFRQQPLISNFKQLQQDAESWLEVAQFRHRQYDVRTEGKIDINYGDTFFLNKADLVPDDDTRTSDSGGNPNTIRLVAKKIVYKISKGPHQTGNFIRYITGIKRIIE